MTAFSAVQTTPCAPAPRTPSTRTTAPIRPVPLPLPPACQNHTYPSLVLLIVALLNLTSSTTLCHKAEKRLKGKLPTSRLRTLERQPAPSLTAGPCFRDLSCLPHHQTTASKSLALIARSSLTVLCAQENALESLTMFAEPRWKRALTLVAALFVQCTCSASTPAALSVTPSTEWVGDDGNWSPIQLLVGTPAQWVYVLVSTASSETWVIGDGGCDSSSLCATERGGLFNETQSSTWTPKGFYELGLDTVLGFAGYGDYGLDDLTFGTTGVTLPGSIISSVNTTEYWNGFFGVGIVPGSFNGVTVLSAISALVEKEGEIPSHSYGYTAGAQYQLKGEPVSLTLGGYDANRLVPHNTSFQLNPKQQPEVYVDSISVVSSASANNWTTAVSLLSTSDRVSATIDSSTPYLWLPASVCERFASSLGLFYNTTLNLYTFDSIPSQHGVLENADLTFTFSLADNSTSNAIVNITLPYAAFDLQLSYPAIPNSTYGSADATKYYFPLRQAANEAQYVIGRAFLQEAYLITNYERNNFSVHQAVHTEDPIGNTSIVDIARYNATSFSGLPAVPSAGLRTGAIIGVVVGCVVGVTSLALLIFWLRSRRLRKDVSDDEKGSGSNVPPRTFLDHVLHRQGDAAVHETAGSSAYATEMATEPHERYELPASLLVEMNSESNTLAETNDSSITRDNRNISAYEHARQKLERQQAQLQVLGTYPPEKSMNDFSHLAHYQARDSVTDTPSPLSSVIGDGSHGSLSVSGNSAQPSPVSPAFRATSHPIPPPMSPPPTYRRTPGNARYGGRIPPDVQLPETVPRVVGTDGRTLDTATEPTTSTLGSRYTENELGNIYDEDSIEVDNSHHSESDARSPHSRGPNWPLEEDTGTRIIGGRVVGEEDESKFRREDILALRADIQTREVEHPHVNRRQIDGEDLVHVPVPAAKRFSWESEAGGTGNMI